MNINAGVTTAKGGIHAAASFTLAGLEHEYGHHLQALQLGTYAYYTTIALPSLYNMAKDKLNHSSYWTEIDANRKAINYFGSGSDIAINPYNYPR